ncbi:MAG: hypothetical protein COW59_08705 [Lysobacterales bacterium CG17_big_fil_post_rev_8_21_14_2_50_64_11]|nr:MAG: hypothetical protein COW59_08705 [Xanthomonadales bacterium CG17_big_fil_post_rev_8_21_14_2_50_64_11]PIX61513.1 MAG: hypothetical protein COZ47_01570 [Xanthomonadales bacterium CG_4_10_14_3_um_filter_64_11]
MRVIHALLVLLFVLVGASFAALNIAPMTVDFYFYQLSVNSGLAVLVAMFVGAVLGAVAVVLGAVLPLQRRLKTLQRRVAPPDSSRTLAGPVDAA